MCDAEENESIGPEQVFSRVSYWIESNDFYEDDSQCTDIFDINTEPIETNIEEGFSDITSITKCLERKTMGRTKKLVVRELSENNNSPRVTGKDDSPTQLKSVNENKMMKPLGKFSTYPVEEKPECPVPFSVITEGQESELPESKYTTTSFKTIIKEPSAMIASNINSRPSSKHKRHVEGILATKSANIERKTRKRKTFDKAGSVAAIQKRFEEESHSKSENRMSKRQQQRKLHAEHFLKSMQMLAANAKPDYPFEDYSIFVYRQTARNFEDRVKDLEKKFTYIPDYDNKPPSLVRGNTDEDFVAKIKSIEQGWQGTQVAEKKPKDLLRKIGKIETSDWNIKEIEKKIKENKMGKPILRDKEKVPKWSREQFVARQTKMEKLDRQDSSEAKYADIDKNIKYLDMKLKEGTNRDLGQNKVATITEKLAKKIPEPSDPIVAKSTDKPVILPSYSGSEFCHFCSKRVYLMERLSAEGRFFHHGCFKCQYCKAQLRLGSYAFDKDGIYGHKFFCLHHYGMQGETRSATKVSRKPSQRGVKPAAKKILSGVSGVDLLDRVRTPERVEFSNLSRCSSDQEDSLSQMDEDEWTDRNFGASTAEIGSSDDEDSSSYSETDSDDEEAYEEALEEPATKEGTMKWAERMSKRHFSKQYKSDSDPYGSSDSSSYYENSSDDDDSNTATEGEEEIRARELRLQEVRLEPPIIQADTGTDTEVISDDNSSDISSEVQNSATEISTDSEFAQDDPTPTSEIPAIILNDLYVNMSRGSSSNRPKKIQVTSGFIQKPNGKAPKQDIELNLTPLVSPAPSLRKITPSIKPPTEAYALNRTQSTGGIASKVSLELKKRYLLGESIGSGSIQKSGSASTLDTKLKSFCSNISDCQKLLKPASEISASMQTFCNKLDEHTSPVLSPLSVNKQLPIESKENNEDVKIEVLPPPDLINVTLAEKNEETVKETFENETEGRPRSPLHETSLIVPEIDWKKIGHSVENTSSSSSSSSSSDEQGNTPNLSHNKIPTVEIHNADDPPDDIKKLWDNHSIASDSVKSIASDKKQLNQPKTLPGLINDIPVGTIKKKSKESTYKKISPQDDRSSECSTPISGGEEITAAFTETELSDWARDGGVSDDLEGMAFDLNIENDVQQKIPELCILNHVCGKTDQEKQVNNEQQSANFDSIEFMDTCTESNSEEGIVDSIGYNLFKNEDITEDSLNPSINENMEEKNTCMDDSKIKNSGYCVLASESSNFGGEVINLKPSDIEQLKHNQNLTEREEDSLVVIETTTEENTCSDSTVKNITEIPIDANKMYETNSQKQRLEEKLVQLKKEKKETILKAQIQRECDKEKGDLDCNNIAEMKNVEFEEHCQRLQSKVDFGNVKDSIDIRKSRRKSRDSPQKQDFIQEEKQYFGSSNSLKEITLNLTPTIKTPEQIYKKEVIEKERDINQKLIQEMVMSKMRAENKALERRVRTRPTNNLNRGFQLSKSATTDMANVNNMSNLENQGASNILKQTSCNFVLKEKEPIIELNALQKSRTSPNIPEDNIRKVVCDLHVPVAPPRSRDLKSSTEKLRNDARVRAKMLSNDELGLSPEDKLQKFREKSKMYDRSISKENSEFQLFPMSLNTQVIPRRKVLQRPLSEYSPKISENRKSFNTVCDDNKQLKMCHSESNLLDMKNGKGKGKEVSPKKGIKFIKIMDLFSKKSPKGLFSKISAKSKDTSKEKPPTNKHARVKSFPEALSQINSTEVPPPVPPLPLCYTEQLLRNPEESSEDELKKNKHTPCETGDASGIFDDSLSSLTERHPHKRNRRSIREAQLKRHRMAQEIQRKLEETEVKTKELEEKGVLIEKNLRGELSQGSSKLESDLLQEWFDIMRDRTELRRYEKELIIRAQELELEDRHARLQHQLRKRLSEENKTEEDKEADCRIINEMLEIVSKRDSLTALLEEDRLRYLSEDRDFEEQMLSKDLYLTPNGKSMKNN
ncbi:hypothetical protein WA026_020144 [Henosepilachna vigintioctopunctata]|uniref:Uncharacterized protein n=1 Tax=Henosepilachna vigintioctopunctata TaxID=420089 RepID=A0AAW1UDE6_9CUCU